MTDPTDATIGNTPRHLWVVGAIALLWNCTGAFDYTMTEARNASYMKAFTPEQLAYFYRLPIWVVATWALGVWGGVLGSLLLLLRSRWAVPIFALSLIAVILTFFHNFVLSDGVAVMGGLGGLLMPALVFAASVALLAYARGIARKGALR